MTKRTRKITIEGIITGELWDGSHGYMEIARHAHKPRTIKAIDWLTILIAQTGDFQRGSILLADAMIIVEHVYFGAGGTMRRYIRRYDLDHFPSLAQFVDADWSGYSSEDDE